MRTGMAALIALAMLIVSVSTYALEMRGMQWGMSKAQVKAKETAELKYDMEDKVIYAVELDDIPTLLVYGFREDQLYYNMYILQNEHANESTYIQDFIVMQRKLNSKYGKPKMEDVIWKNAQYKDDPQNWGKAIELGHLHLQSGWQVDDTAVILDLHSEKNKLWHVISLRSNPVKANSGVPVRAN